MAVSYEVYTSPLYQFGLMWDRFWYLYHLHSRQRDLQGLIAWAKRKRLKGVQHAYTRQLENLENTLGRYRLQERDLTFWAADLNDFIYTLFPPRYRKGYGKKYRRAT